MMGTYYGLRPMVRERTFREPVMENGVPVFAPDGTMALKAVTKRVVETYDFSHFKHLWLRLGVDVGAASYFSEIAMTQTLDNLHMGGALDVIQYLERLPDRLIPRKEELIEELKKARSSMEPQTNKDHVPLSSRLSKDKALAQEPVHIQSIYESLPETAQRAIVEKHQA